MSENKIRLRAQTRKRRWPRNLAIVCGGLIILSIVAWFVLTSAAFFRAVILPQAGEAMNASVTAEDASIKPFKEILLRNLKVQPSGTEPVLLEVRELKVSYDLLALFGAEVRVKEIRIDSPVVTVVQNPDGSRNVDPLLQPGTEPDTPKSTQADQEIPKVVLGAFNLTNATLRYIRIHPDGARDQLEVTGLNIALNNVGNGQSGRLRFGLRMAADLNLPQRQHGSMTLAHEGSYDFTLGPNLVPTTIQGGDWLEITKADGALKELAGFRADVVADVSPSEIKQIRLNLKKADTDLGGLQINGPFEGIRQEGRLTVVLSGIDRPAFNLVGGLFGIDFGSPTLHGSNVVEIVAGGTQLGLKGRFDISNMQLTRANQSTPVLDLSAAYDLFIDNAAQTATLKELAFDGLQNHSPVLNSRLNRPMTLSWGRHKTDVSDSTLTVNLSKLNLSDWRAFAGTNASGVASATLRLDCHEAGELLSFDLNSKLTGYALPSSQMEAFDLAFDAKGGVAAFKQFDVGKFQLAASEAGNPLFTVSGSAACALAKSNVNARVTLSLPSTSRAPTNAGNLILNVDMADPDGVTGFTKLEANTLDLTELADRLAAKTDVEGTRSALETAPPKESLPATEKEPDPMRMPLRDYQLQARIGRLWFREIEVSDLKADASLTDHQVLVDPLQFQLNEAPVTGAAKLNLGVPGWEYDLSLSSIDVPIAPLADSFLPEYRGATRGSARAEFQLAGAGITTPSLVQNLSGKTSLELTNASVRMPKRPATATARTLRSVLLVVGQALQVPELLDAPIASFNIAATIGEQQVNIRAFDLTSQSFKFRTRGQVALSPTLTNSSLNGFPVELSLSRPLAQRARLTTDTGSGSLYVDLGRLATVNGTLGDPKTKLDMVRIAALTAQGIGNLDALKGTETGAILQSLSGLLGNKGTTNHTGSATNDVQPQKHTTGEALIQGLGGLLGKPRTGSTNTPSNAQ